MSGSLPDAHPLAETDAQSAGEQIEASMTPLKQRFFLSLWSYLAARPAMYRLVGVVTGTMRALARGRPVLRHLPPMKGWTDSRDLIVLKQAARSLPVTGRGKRVMAMNDRSIILERLQSANESRSRSASARQHRLLPAI